jgi:hypothetical protein
MMDGKKIVLADVPWAEASPLIQILLSASMSAETAAMRAAVQKDFFLNFLPSSVVFPSIICFDIF